MRKSRRSPWTEQFALFDPPKFRPSWQTLPATIREEVIGLLAKLYHSHLAPGNNKTTGGHRDE
jgi:hypothetical protein